MVMMWVKPALAVSGGVALYALVLRALACTPFGTAATDDAGSFVAPLPDASTRFCASQDASFCADFDEAPDAAAGWSGVALDLGGTISETATAVSPPWAFSSQLGLDGGQARLSWNYPVTTHHTALSFDVMLRRSPSPSPDNGVEIVELDCTNRSDSGAIDWGGVWLGSGTDPDSGAPITWLTSGGTSYPLPNLPDDVWTHLVMVVDWGPATVHITLTAGPVTFDKTTPSNCIGKADAFVLLGNIGTYPGEVILDNVVLGVVP
jgi:hypothetical protein